MTPAQITAKIASGYIKAANITGAPVVYRRITSTGGASPATNPVTGNITVQSSASAGASLITLTAPAGNWFLEVGDVLTIGGSDYAVTARKVSASGKFTDVAISPALSGNVSAGTAVTVTWQADYPCRARVTGFQSDLIDGTTIKASDMKVRLPIKDADGRTIPQPTAMDKIYLNGLWQSVGIVQPQYEGEGPVWYDVQAK